MNRCLSLTLSIAAVFVLSAGAKAQTEGQKALLKNEIEKDLVDNILPFWEKCSPDPSGGFYGTVSREGTGDPHSPKAGVLNTRILWTFSSAYRIYGLPQYKEMADRAQKYVIENLIDKKYGGIYWLVGSDGIPADATKQTYATAFGIYSLSEHFRATGNKQSLQKAIELYGVMETKVHDKVGKGWLETHTRDWNKPVTKGVDGKEGATKTMNTHIHVMEAYTNLYRVWPDAGLRENLLELLDILQTKLYNPQTKHLILFCDDNWNSIGNVDSYGHDIETSWLMSECARVLGDEELIAKIDRQAVEMVDAALAEGVNPDGSMIYEFDEGIFRSEGPLRPTQRFFNLKQLSMTPENVFSIPLSKDKENVTAAAFANTARGESAVHIVNNGASCPAEVTGLPAGTTKAYVYVTDTARKAEAQLLPVKDGVVTVFMPADSFVSIISE